MRYHTHFEDYFLTDITFTYVNLYLISPSLESNQNILLQSTKVQSFGRSDLPSSFWIKIFFFEDRDQIIDPFLQRIIDPQNQGSDRIFQIPFFG